MQNGGGSRESDTMLNNSYGIERSDKPISKRDKISNDMTDKCQKFVKRLSADTVASMDACVLAVRAYFALMLCHL